MYLFCKYMHPAPSFRTFIHWIPLAQQVVIKYLLTNFSPHMIEVRVCVPEVCFVVRKTGLGNNRTSATNLSHLLNYFHNRKFVKKKNRNRKSKWIIHEAYFSFLRTSRGCCIIPAKQNGSLHLHRHRQRLNPLQRWFIQHKIIWIRIQHEVLRVRCIKLHTHPCCRVLCVPSCSIPCVVCCLQLCRTFSVWFSSILICVPANTPTCTTKLEFL